MVQAPKRRKNDSTSLLLGAAKATGGFVFFGALSFVGSWGVSLNSSVAQLKQDVAVIHEKQEFLAPWLVGEVRGLREDIKEMRKELREARK